MRKIEENMLKAIVCGKSWLQANTQVKQQGGHNFFDVYLHGNHIANVQRLPNKLNVTPNLDTFRQWPS